MAATTKAMPTHDPAGRRAFAHARRSESQYARQLRKLAQHVADLIAGFPSDTLAQVEALKQALERYALTVNPWATAVAKRMLTDISVRDASAWELFTRQMGQSLRREILQAPTGALLAELEAQQVALITSLPLHAAQNVHTKALEALSSGRRHEELAKDILAQGGVTKSRAKLIARTEVARATSNLTQARAQYIGSEGYIWRTTGDSDVRPTHKRMEGKFIRWDTPLVVDDGVAPYHAGCIYNCRCYPEPVVPDRFD